MLIIASIYSGNTLIFGNSITTPFTVHLSINSRLDLMEKEESTLVALHFMTGSIDSLSPDL